MNQIVFNLSTSEKRAAILQDGKVVEILVERPDAYPKAGNIYMGRITKVLPGIDAAFIDIGFAQNGFIHATDLKRYKEDQGAINELVHEGQWIIVQVRREASKNKGPLLVENITIPGENLVYLPFGGHVAVSKKLSEREKEEVKRIGESIIHNPEGLIMRTSSSQCDMDQLKEEVDVLRQEWNAIESRGGRKVSLLYEGSTIVDTALNHHSNGTAELIFDDVDVFRTFRNKYQDRFETKLYKGTENVFSYYDIEQVIQKALRPMQWLANGGQIQVDTTEALTVIDVNTGKFTGKQDRESAILETNLLAAEEAARQLRLRNISGMIVIDFIRMKEEEHKQKVQKRLHEHLQRDPVHTKIYGYTALGLMEVTRQKVRDSLVALMTENDSSQPSYNVETMFYALERTLFEFRHIEEEAIWIELSPRLYDYVNDSDCDRENRLSSGVPSKLFFTKNKVSDPYGFRVRQQGSLEKIEARINKELH
ncbi:Rne/Rng family ribonuclease [Pseudalkalibacillus sp. SCS-8]|uniref:Rne/Rng family ribonuclease n=1 Tax=Pseudalkalibacillus nanhaiensis TaxID=3115291 RepID=UPI0032DB3032